MRDRLPLSPGVDQRQRQEAAYGVVQRVRCRIQLGHQQRHALLQLAEVAQRAGQLDDGPAAAFAGQAACEGHAVERDGPVGVAGRVEGCGPLEARHGAVGRQLGGELLDACQEVGLGAVVDRGPGGRDPSLPVCFVHGVTLARAALR